MSSILKTNALESEAIYIFREVISQFDKPVLLFSGGKDSITLVRLAQKAFFPAKIPFPLLHVDTGHNFPETIEFRDRLVAELGLELISRSHGLVADDAVEFSRIAPNMIEGRCPPLLQNLLEVRGLGLLDIKAIFGETAVRRKMRLKLIVHLVRRSTLEESYQRLPIDSETQEVLGL